MTENTEQAGQRSGTIVVGIDGSPASERSLRYALTIADALGSAVTAVCAWQLPVDYGAGFVTDWKPDDDARASVRALISTVFPDGAPSWFSARIAEGPAARVLIEESDGASMLVVGSRGHGGFAGLLLGSVSQTCAEYAKCPVLIYHDAGARQEH